MVSEYNFADLSATALDYISKMLTTSPMCLHLPKMLGITINMIPSGRQVHPSSRSGLENSFWSCSHFKKI
jgi:hypothetical protein